MDNSGKPWNIVFGHHPVYSQGGHGDTDLVQQFIWNVLFEQEVDFYLSGHDHHLNALRKGDSGPVSYTHLRAHETREDLGMRLKH